MHLQHTTDVKYAVRLLNVLAAFQTTVTPMEAVFHPRRDSPRNAEVSDRHGAPAAATDTTITVVPLEAKAANAASADLPLQQQPPQPQAPPAMTNHHVFTSSQPHTVADYYCCWSAPSLAPLSAVPTAGQPTSAPWELSGHCSFAAAAADDDDEMINTIQEPHEDVHSTATEADPAAASLGCPPSRAIQQQQGIGSDRDVSTAPLSAEHDPQDDDAGVAAGGPSATTAASGRPSAVRKRSKKGMKQPKKSSLK
jgi:hypothetical protein